MLRPITAPAAPLMGLLTIGTGGCERPRGVGDSTTGGQLSPAVAPTPAPVLTAVTGRPTCALLDPAKHSVVALLEARLLTDPSAAWVERKSVGNVLKEQALRAAFAPDGVGERVRLGRLLRADLLVLVRPVEGSKDPALEVVVSESDGGLRLAVRTVLVTANPDAAAAALVAAVKDGVDRGREPVRGLVAVPPFVCHDLGFEADHLKSVYAKLVEGVALARPGVVAVELAEAEAVAREVALAAPGSGVTRPLPVYLLGEYRHDGAGAARRVTLTLRAERGGRPAARPGGGTASPDGVPAILRTWAAGALDELGGVPLAAADPRAEARQLAERAATFYRLGNWDEAAALYEAAAFLDPDDIDLRSAAVRSVTRMIEAVLAREARSKPSGQQRPDPDTVREFGGLQRRGLEQLEALYTPAAMVVADRRRPPFLTPTHDFLTQLGKFAPFGTPSPGELELQW